MGFDILHEKTDLEKRLLVEASAGTGKTFTIEHLFLRLLLEKKIPLTSILVLTFTKAATRELKARIRENIRTVLEGFKGSETLPPYLEKHQSNQEFRDILQQAYTSFDQAKIFTIHSFCQQMLQQYACETEHGLFSPQEDGEKKIEAFAREYLLSHSSCYPFEMKRAYKRAGYEIEQLIRQILTITPLSSPTSTVSLLNTLYGTFQEQKISLSGQIEPLTLNYKVSSFSKDLLSQEISLLEELSYQQPLLSFIETINKALSSGEFLSFFTPSNERKNKKTDLSFIMSFFLHDLLPLLQELADSHRILSLFAIDLQERVYSFCLEEEIATPDNLLLRMQRSLESSSFVQAIQKEVKVAIIDEFQDTDPVQWEILSHLFHTPTHFLYVVGDPKQSIYGFRNADIYTYLQAKDLIGNSAALDKNFRSTTTLISALNRLLSTQTFPLPKTQQSLLYQPVHAGKKEEGISPAVEFFLGKTPSRKSSSKQEELELFYPFIAKEILSIPEEERQKVAILVKDKNQAKEIQKFLSSMGIHSLWSKKEYLGKSKAAQACKDLIEALLEPHNESAIRKVLLGPFCNFFSVEKIEKAHRLLFFQWKEELAKGVSFFLKSFLSTRIGENCMMASMMNHNLLYEQTIEILELLSSVPITPFAVTAFFESLLEVESKAMSSRNHAVQMMTMHMSKGLEFDRVFAMGVLPRNNKKDSSFREEEEIDAEKQRQLYVAFTRAKKKLYIPILFDEKEKAPPVGKASPMEIFLSQAIHGMPYEAITQKQLTDYLASFPSSEISTTQLPISFSKPAKVSTKEELIPPKDRVIKQPSLPIVSFTSTSASYEGIPFYDEEDDIKGASFGSFLHELLAYLLSKTFTEEEAKKVIEEKVLRSPYSSHSSFIVEMLLPSLYSPTCLTIPLMDLPLINRFAEIDFHFLSPKGKIWKGIIDLLFFHEEKYYLLDWKSNHLGSRAEDYSTEALHNAMKEGDYYRQGAIYKEAVDRFVEKNDIANKYTFGGIFYLFLRGIPNKKGIYHFFPSGDEFD